MFDTYGPFTLQSHDKEGIDALYQEIQNDDTSDLQLGVGVYIVAANNDDGVLLPWYVGRTFREFGWRLKDHLKGEKFVELCNTGPLTIFLLARAKQGRVLSSSEASNAADRKAIAYLELVLIGTCLKLNTRLMNKHQKRFHEMLHVAGYLDNGSEERDFPAARALSSLLHT